VILRGSLALRVGSIFSRVLHARAGCNYRGIRTV